MSKPIKHGAKYKCLLYFNFDLGDKVKIPQIENIGKIVAIWYGEDGLQYKVRYFLDGKPNEIYFYDDELTPLNK